MGPLSVRFVLFLFPGRRGAGVRRCYASISLAILMRLYAAPTRYAANSVRCLPLKRVLRKPPTVFIQPQISSIRFRALWLIRYPGQLVVRASIAERRRISVV